MSQSAHQPPPGWYPDPAGSGDERYWDGGTWSQVTRPAGGLQAGAPAGYGPNPAAAQGPGAQYAQYAPYAQQGHPGGYAPGYGAHPGYGSGQLAGWWWRVLATVIDSLALLIPLSIVQNLLLGEALQDLVAWLDRWAVELERGSTVTPPLPEGFMGAYWTYLLVTALIWIAYRTVMVAKIGGTVGQLATGLRVVRDGDHSLGLVGWSTSALRAALAIVINAVPVLNLVNYLMPLFTAKKQTLHDMAAKTVVVKK